MKLINARGVSEELDRIQQSFVSYHEPMLKSIAVSSAIQKIILNKKNPEGYRIEPANEGYEIYFQNKKHLSLNKIHEGYTKFAQEGDKDFKAFDLSGLNQKRVSAFLDSVAPGWQELVKKLSHESFLVLINHDMEMQNYNDIFNEQLGKVVQYAKNHKSKKNAYYFNDLDNALWQQKNIYKLTSQDLIFNIQENEGVYTITCDYKSLSEGEKKPEFEIVFDSKEGEYQFKVKKLMQPHLLHAFMLDLEHAVKSYEENYRVEVPINDVVKSYKYHLAYMNHNFDSTKEQAIWRMVFYCFPEAKGTDAQGNYAYDEREKLPYQKAVEKKMDTIHETITHSEFTIPVSYQNNKIFKKIKNLNEDWKEFFKDAHELVADFIVRYENASASQKAKMSYAKEKELLPELQEFLEITDRLINQPQKSLKMK
jgi:hypothetical protein